MINFKRTFKHLLTTQRSVRSRFPAQALDTIERAIRSSEETHYGEIQVCIESSLDLPSLFANKTARERAIELFSMLRIWDTEQNNGVLIYLLLADRQIEIMVDRGILRVTGDDFWNSVCRKIEEHFRNQDFEAGILKAIEEIHVILKRHYRQDEHDGRDDTNELPNRPVIL